jgi:D-alanine transaminase
MTSSAREVLAIIHLDGSPVGDGRPGPVFRQMYRLYQDYKNTVMRAA